MEILNLPAVIPTAEKNLSALIAAYKTDPLSPYHKGRHCTRRFYDTLLRRIDRDHGHVLVGAIKARDLLEWHHSWVGPEGKHPMAHALMGMLRTITGYGSAMLDNEECRVVKGHLSYLRFQMGKPRAVFLSTEQVIKICNVAHDMGYHSIAFAQALQNATGFRQKDVIGEWVPDTEPVTGIVHHNGMKWLRGLVWEEMDAQLKLNHVTSKKQKPRPTDLRLAPLVMREFARIPDSVILAGGPMVLDERYGLPYNANRFRRVWRKVADAAGIPKEIRNMDTRSGFATESLRLGISKHTVMKMMTHSNQSTTERYARGDADEIASGEEIRAKYHEELLRA